MWSATAECEEFREAVDWFKGRLPVTTAKLAEMGDGARQRAFWITGVAQLDVIDDVHKSIIEALKKGTPFAEWQQSIGEKLTNAWGKKNAWRVEVIYRNATQQAYIAGRLKQLRDPVVLALRPFWKFVAIDDGRCPTGICPLCNGTTLPADHPWWDTHTPQLHHGCRCRFDSLRKPVAEKQGITETPPEQMPPDGWGKPPDLQTVEEFKKPVQKRIAEKVHPELANEFERKQATEAPKPPPKPKENPDHTPNRWEPYFRSRGYDKDSARLMAHGRAMQERGLDMKAASVVKALEPFSEYQAISARMGDVRRSARQRDLTVRELLAERPEYKASFEAAASLAAHTKEMSGKTQAMLDAVIDTAAAANQEETDRARLAAKKARVFFTKMVSEKHNVGSPDVAFYNASWGDDLKNARGEYRPMGNSIICALRDAANLEHELWHAVEKHTPDALKRSLAFLKSRTKNEPIRPLRELDPKECAGNGADEIGRKDKFWTAYVGRHYEFQNLVYASEVSTMGIQKLLTRPEEFMGTDPEFFYWVLGQLAAL